MPAQSDSSGTNTIASCPYFLPGGDTFKFGVKLLRKRNKGSEIRIASQIEANRKSYSGPKVGLEEVEPQASKIGNIVPGVLSLPCSRNTRSRSRSIDCISVGVDRMQRNFEPMRKQVETWQRSELTDVTAKVVIYEAFVEGRLEAPKHLARTVHDLYFEPKYEEFRPRTIWSLSNAFTSAFKELDPIPQFKATAKLGEFLEARFSQSF